MSASDVSVLAYLRLAAVAHERRQAPSVDRLLLLAGAAAAEAGFLELAERCRALVVTRNPRHLVARQPSLADALRDPDYQAFQRQLQRFCTPEQAEHLVSQATSAVPPSAISVSEEATLLLDRITSGAA